MSEKYRNDAIALQVSQKCEKMSAEEEDQMLRTAFERGVVRIETKELLDWDIAKRIADEQAGGLCSREDFISSGLKYVDGVDLWAYASRDDGTIEAVQLGAPGYHDRYISHRGKYSEGITLDLTRRDREEWLYKHIQQDHIFAKRSETKNPAYVPRDCSKENELREKEHARKIGAAMKNRERTLRQQILTKRALLSPEEEEKLLRDAFEKGVVRIPTGEVLNWHKAKEIAEEFADGLLTKEELEKSGFRYPDGFDHIVYALHSEGKNGGVDSVQLGSDPNHGEFAFSSVCDRYNNAHDYTNIENQDFYKQMDYVLAKRSLKKNPEYIPKDFTKEDEIWNESKGKKKGGKQVQPIEVEFINGGVWTVYKNIDMCGQGDVDIIGDWQKSHSIEALRRKVEEKGYSAFAISPDSVSYAHAALKKFNYNLTPVHCKPTDYECHIHIWNKFGSGCSDKNKAIGRQMTLVKRGSSNQAVFEDIELLREGKVASGKLSSHGGNVSMGRQYYEERRHDIWGYIESQCVAENDDNAMYFQYVDDCFLKLVNLDLVLDVAFWQMHEGASVNFVGSRADHEQTKKGGGGRDWTLNSDGTISAKHHPHLCLGF